MNPQVICTIPTERDIPAEPYKIYRDINSYTRKIEEIDKQILSLKQQREEAAAMLERSRLVREIHEGV